MSKKIITTILVLITLLLCSCDAIEYQPNGANQDMSSNTEYSTNTGEKTDSSNVNDNELETDNNDEESNVGENINPTNPSIKHQFVEIGFNESEAQDLENKFNIMGLTEIRDIKLAIGNGIDGLQSFIAKVFDTEALTLQFTIENRQLCYVSLNGFRTEKIEGVYVNIWGNLKFKIVDSKASIVLYDIWDENGEIIEGATGYKAIYDYKNNLLSEYVE